MFSFSRVLPVHVGLRIHPFMRKQVLKLQNFKDLYFKETFWTSIIFILFVFSVEKLSFEKLWKPLSPKVASISFQSPIISTITNKIECFCTYHFRIWPFKDSFGNSTALCRKMVLNLQENHSSMSDPTFLYLLLYFKFPSRHSVYLHKNPCNISFELFIKTGRCLKIVIPFTMVHLIT